MYIFIWKLCEAWNNLFRLKHVLLTNVEKYIYNCWTCWIQEHWHNGINDTPVPQHVFQVKPDKPLQNAVHYFSSRFSLATVSLKWARVYVYYRLHIPPICHRSLYSGKIIRVLLRRPGFSSQHWNRKGSPQWWNRWNKCTSMHMQMLRRQIDEGCSLVAIAPPLVPKQSCQEVCEAWVCNSLITINQIHTETSFPGNMSLHHNSFKTQSPHPIKDKTILKFER